MIPILDTVLNEAASPETYAQMFPNVPAFTKWSSVTSSRIEWAIRVLKSNSRVQWYMKVLKIWIINREMDNLKSHSDFYQNDPGYLYLKKLYDREIRKIEGKIEGGHVENILGLVSREALTFLEHFFDSQLSNLPEIRNYEIAFKTWETIRRELNEIEEKYASSEDATDSFPPHRVMSFQIELQDGWVVFYRIEGNNRFRWLDTVSSSSRRLALAMSDTGGVGHCGTCQRPSSSILVLAEFLDEDRFVPHLTFELSARKEILQAKGYKNGKPSPRYHDMIVEMILNTDVERIKGGNYKPETDFKFEDLSSENQEKILEAKPDINDNSMDIVEEFRRNGISDEFIRLARKNIDSWIEKDSEIEGYIAMPWGGNGATLQSFLRDLDFMDYQQLYHVEYDLDDVERYGYEKYIIGEEVYDSVNYSVFSRFMDSVMADAACSRYVTELIPNLRGDALYREIWNRSGKASSRIRELVVRSIAFGSEGIKKGITLQELEFMAYVGRMHLSGFTITLRDDNGSIVKLQDVADFDSFLDLSVVFTAPANQIVYEIEDYNEEDEGEYDPDRCIWGNDGYSYYHLYNIQDEGDFEKFMSSEWSDHEEVTEWAKEEYRRRYGESQPDLFDDDTFQEDITYDTESALDYMRKKISHGVIESLSKQVLRRLT